MIFIVFLLLPLTVCGQRRAPLPELADDPSIIRGTLPNGVAYYLAGEQSSKDLCGFSLVQKTDGSLDEETLYDIAREDFASVNYGDVTLADFLCRNGMRPSAHGYIECRRGAVIYSFDGYSSKRGESVLDTVLLSVFRLAEASAARGRPSSSQAVTVAGDFDSSLLLSKMKTLCLVNPYVPGSVDDSLAHVDHGPGPGITASGGAAARLTVRWRMPRTPQRLMSTVLPDISGKLASEMGHILADRLHPVFRAVSDDVWIDFRHTDSGHCAGGETLELEVSCPRPVLAGIGEVLREELDRLLTFGVDEDEYVCARDAVKFAWMARSRSLWRPATSYMDRCASSFLYGTSLAGDTERIRFAYRDLPDSTQARFFNNYLRGVLSQTSSADSTLAPAPEASWRDDVDDAIRRYAEFPSLKAPKDKTEYVTGGLIWTFSNGVNVIYRQMPARGMLYFSYASKGGRVFAGKDNFNTIEGVPGDMFAAYAASYGMELRSVLNPADVRLEGSVPEENMGRTLALLAALTDRPVNRKAFGTDCYKLLILVGDMEPEKVKKLLCRYVPALRQGSRWKAVKYVGTEKDELSGLGGYSLSDRMFPLDVTSYNYAVAAVAQQALSDRMGHVFAGYGVKFFLQAGYAGFPLNDYRLVYGVRHVPLKHFPPYCLRLGEDKAAGMMDSLLKNLAREPLSPDLLGLYKSLAKDSFASEKVLPGHVIDAAAERYLNSKDLFSKFNEQVEAVTAADLMKFYASAAYSDR